MSSILLITDNEVLSSLYTVNLKIYTHIDVYIESSLDDAIGFIENPKNPIDLVICSDSINNEEVALIVYNELVESALYDIPFIVVGDNGSFTDEMAIYPDPYDVKSVIQAVASRLGITAKSMVEQRSLDYYPMPLRMFFSLEAVPCDTFVKKADQFNLIFSAGDGIWPKIKDYLDQGVTTLFVPANYKFEFAKYVTNVLIKKVEKINKSTPREQKLDVVQQGIETIAERVFNKEEVTQEVIDLSHKCMKVMMDVVEGTPGLNSIIKELTHNKSGFLYSHSIISGVVAAHILDNIEWGGETHKEKLKYVLFFHDMMLTPVYKNHADLQYEEGLVFDQRLSEEEKEIVVSHAAMASELLKQYPKTPLGVEQIILQHHGTTNGMGFATSYKDDISPLAKVLIVAETFTEHLLESLYSGEKFSREQTVNQLIEKYPKHTYVKISKTLLDIAI